MKKETLEEFISKKGYDEDTDAQEFWSEGIREGAKWQQERSYSEEEVKEIVNHIMIQANETEFSRLRKFIDLQFEQFKKL